MPISGLLVTVDEKIDPQLIVKEIGDHPDFELGEVQGKKLPVVLDTKNQEENKQCLEWLYQIKGVAFVDVVFVHLDEADHQAA